MNGNDARNKRLEEYIERICRGSYSQMRSFKNYISNVALSTQYQYMTQVNDFLNKSGKYPHKLTHKDFAKDLEAYRYKENGEETTSGAQATRYFALKKFSEFLYKSGEIKEDYMQDIEKPQRTELQKTSAKHETNVMASNEVKTLMKNLDSDIEDSDGVRHDMALRNRAIFYLFLTTGISSKALIALDLKDVNLEAKTLRVVTRKKSRIFDLSDGCVEALSDWLEVRMEAPYKKAVKDAVFITHKTKHTYKTVYFAGYDRIEPWELNALVKDKTKFTGRNLSPQSLRATYGTLLYGKTKDIYLVQYCLGHANVTSTAGYIRGIPSNTKKASDIMDDIIG